MRRILTWVVVAAVAVIGAAATADALRGSGESVPRAAEPTGIAAIRAREAERAASHLREARSTGILTYSDENCRLHAITLPDLEPADAPGFEMCEPFSGSGGISAFDGDVVWSGLGYQTVQVVLSREELNSLLDRDDLAAHQAVSLGPDAFAVLAEGRDGDWIVAIHEGDRVVRAAGGFGGERVFLRPSPHGRHLGLLLPDRPGVQAVDRAGRAVQLPAVTRPHAIAWSPNERWTAMATGASVYVFRTREPEGELIRIPIAVRDLAWDAE